MTYVLQDFVCVLFAGAERLVKHLYKHGIPIATATGSHTQSFELKTSKHKDLFSLFHHCVLSGDDPECKHGKPAPDCFLLAAQRFPDNPDPSKVSTSTNVWGLGFLTLFGCIYQMMQKTVCERGFVIARVDPDLMDFQI